MMIKSPNTEQEFNDYYNVRWEILRKPWDQPIGSEKDEREEDSYHIAAFDDNNKVLGVGRLHLNNPDEAQIRYMAMKQKGKGIGSKIVKALEEHAKELNAKYIILNARENAVNFYLNNGYEIVKQGFVLYGIQHSVMRKNI